MPELTPRIGLLRPLGTDYVTREAYAENLDIIDAAVVRPEDVANVEATIDPAEAPTGNAGTLGQLLGWLANRIRAITGAAYWWSTPPTTLQAAKTHMDAAAPHSGHETPAGAQAKADAAEARAKAYTDQEVGEVSQALAAHKAAAAPHTGHETPSGAQAKVDTHANTKATLAQLGHVNHRVLTTTLNTAWQGSGPYTKTQTVNGLLATDTPIVDVVMSGNFATDEARIEAWGYVYRITTANNAITLYATEKPTVSLPIQLKVVR